MMERKFRGSRTKSIRNQNNNRSWFWKISRNTERTSFLSIRYQPWKLISTSRSPGFLRRLRQSAQHRKQCMDMEFQSGWLLSAVQGWRTQLQLETVSQQRGWVYSVNLLPKTWQRNILWSVTLRQHEGYAWTLGPALWAYHLHHLGLLLRDAQLHHLLVPHRRASVLIARRRSHRHLQGPAHWRPWDSGNTVLACIVDTATHEGGRGKPENWWGHPRTWLQTTSLAFLYLRGRRGVCRLHCECWRCSK